MAAEVIADVSCAALNHVQQPPDPAAVHRFLVGSDPGPVKLSQAEATAQLGDPLATLLFLKGVFPRTGTELAGALRAAAGDADPLARIQTFVLAEGSDIVFSAETASLDRGVRFVVAIGGDKPDVIISVFGPDDAFIEAMGWDRARGGFNFYRTVHGAWMFAGNSRHALTGPTAGKGPFESHVSGGPLMKELRFPWVNWNSPRGGIPASIFAPDDPLPRHPWFTGKLNADVFEKITRASIARWNKVRFAERAESARVVLRQVVESQTVNLICSSTESRLAQTAQSPVALPQTFFVDSEALTEILGLPAPPAITVSSELYRSTLERFEFRRAAPGFERAGDTRFAFVVPERAFEDTSAVREATKSGLISERLAACLLMVDFPNPVFSARRASLLAHASDVPDAQFSQATADAILAAAQPSPQGSPEREFAERWDAGEDWKSAFTPLLEDYYATLRPRAETQDGFDDYTRLAQSRRARLREMPIFENKLLLPESNLPAQQLEMRPDGTVREAT
ncbi:MAG: hypothetical protein QOG15_2849 [Solirubrobacteraceae bacterium]|nr:hypothetical protein [Solirubrobacteraceae bacterium]